MGLLQHKLLAFYFHENSVYHADYELTLWLEMALLSSPALLLNQLSDVGNLPFSCKVTRVRATSVVISINKR